MLLVFLEIVMKLVSSTTWTVRNSTVHRKSKDDDTAPTKSCFSGGLKEITIINDINSTELIVHCKSKGADLGVIKLLTSQYFQFESCNQVFGMTLFLLQFCMG